MLSLIRPRRPRLFVLRQDAALLFAKRLVSLAVICDHS